MEHTISSHTCHKSTPAGKSQTIARKGIRSDKYGTPRNSSAKNTK